MKKIDVGNNKFALIDDEDFELVMFRNDQYAYQKNNEKKWSLKISDKIEYAITNIRKSKNQWCSIKMHQLILGDKLSLHLVCDHRDGNGLNNQKSNLRICTQHQNSFNSRKRSGTKSIYKGVSRLSNSHKWRSYIVINNKQIHLGLFEVEIDAALAYNEKARELFGDFACLNQI